LYKPKLIWLAGLFDQGERGGLEGTDDLFNFLVRKGANVATLSEFNLYDIFKDISELRDRGTIKRSIGKRNGSDAGIKTIKDGGG